MFNSKNYGLTIVYHTDKQEFGVLTHSAISSTKLPVEIWFEYAKAMIVGYSIRKCAIVAGVSVKTSFYMRHKILDAIRLHQALVQLKVLLKWMKLFLQSHLKEIIKRQSIYYAKKTTKKRKGNKKKELVKRRFVSHRQQKETEMLL